MISAPSDRQQTPVFWRKQGFVHNQKAKRKKEKSLYQAFDVLYSGGQETLLTHVVDAKYAGIAEAMVFFRLRKGTFNRLFSPFVYASTVVRLRKEYDIVQGVLPYMTFHHPSVRAGSKALGPSGTAFTLFAVAEVLSVAFPGRGAPVKVFLFRTDVNVVFKVIVESVFSVVFSRMGMPSIAYDSLDLLLFQ